MAAETFLKVKPPPPTPISICFRRWCHIFIIIQFKSRTHCSIEINLHYAVTSYLSINTPPF